jgi:predicted tellurium resistance membrane protein TerC
MGSSVSLRCGHCSAATGGVDAVHSPPTLELRQPSHHVAKSPRHGATTWAQASGDSLGDDDMMDSLAALAADPTAWVALLTLVALEVVLGIDNLIFISILTNKLPEHERGRARRIGIGLALVMRLGLLGTIAWIARATQPIELFGWPLFGLSWRDVILIAGGLFLVWKATKEIHHSVDPSRHPDFLDGREPGLSFAAAITQILILDLVFSVDSIITAVGMTPHVPIMVIAVVTAVAVMLAAADPLARFIHKNPTIVMLALAFLLMIGMTLIAEGFGAHVPKGYIYAAMAFSVAVEVLNMLSRRAHERRTAALAARAEATGQG